MIQEILDKYNPPLPPDNLPGQALKLHWTGTAGFQVEYRGHTLLIDPFVTRCSIWRIPFLRQPVNETLAAEVFPKADSIIIGHSHYDHLQDVPAIAKKTGAIVYGSSSTAAVCRGAEMDESQIREIKTRLGYDIGPFKVTFVPSQHGKVLFGRVPFQGEITGAPGQPMYAKEFKVGGTFGLLIETGGFRMCHFGSANLIDEEQEKIGKIDLLLMGISGRQKTPQFLERMTTHLKPQHMLIHHYDNFFKPLRGGRIVFRGVHLKDFVEEYESTCPEVQLLMPDFFQPVAFDITTKSIVHSGPS